MTATEQGIEMTRASWVGHGLWVPAVIGLGLLTGCQPTAPTAPATPGPPPVPASSALASGPAPAGSRATASPAGAAALAGCTKAGLALSTGSPSSGSGHRSVVVVFTNTANRPCRLVGYPGVAALNAGGDQVAQARRTAGGYLGGLAGGGQPPVVTLLAGQSASAMVEAMAFNPADGSACAGYRGLLVTAPDDVESTRLPWDTDGCADLQVHPVVPGTTGRG